jgi:adenylate cyclase
LEGRDGGSGTRSLGAIMFTDMVGFTALGQADEALAMELLEEQRRVVRPILLEHHGREVKTIGDAFLVEFASALEAVNCAAAVQSSLRELNSSRQEKKKILVRIGIHLGDVIHTGPDVAGDAVNIASRIQALAPPGGVCVTGQVYSSVLNKAGFAWEGLGSPELKNVAVPIEVYRLVGYGQGSANLPPPRTALPKERVAVLPLANIGPDPSDEYFADGMTEELISSVSRTKGLRVIARTSVMRYKGAMKPISEIGRELNVGSVVEGSVRKAGDRLRVTVQLVETSNEEPRWSQEYDREVKDVFEIQSDIAQRVAEALRERVLGPGAGEGRQTGTRSAEAYIYYLRGRQAWNKRTEEGLKDSIRFHEQALVADPGYAKAFSGVADSYAALALLEMMAPNEAFPRAKEAAGRALALDPHLPEARTSLGLIKFQYDWDWAGAEGEFKEAIAASPSYAPAHHFYADYLKAMGRFDEALAEIGRAQELDPLNLAINTGVGHVLYLARHYDRAIEQYKKAVELNPDFMLTHIWFGRPYLEKGMYAEAISELEKAVRLSGESTLALAMLGHGLASAGRKDDAVRILSKLEERSKTQYVPSYWIAVVYNGLRDRDRVIEWLGRALGERSSWLVWCNVEPRFDWIRRDRGFVSLLSSMKFPGVL